MQIQQNVSLKGFNTFGIDASAKYFSSFSSAESLEEALSSIPGKKFNFAGIRSAVYKKTALLASEPLLLILGGGSNILFTKVFKGLVLKNNILGIQLIKEDEHYVYVKVGAGENWNQFVSYCVARNWGGLENLSLIPGNIGASPMQNVGAYGVELKEVFDELEAFQLMDKKVYTLSVNDCEFGYRDSAFKNKYKGQFVILNVTFRLNKVPRFNTSYTALARELEIMGVHELSIKAISKAVIQIRSSKLPDPSTLGNAGSFFKNPRISPDQFKKITKKHPGILGYEDTGGKIKLAAGWLIEQCGWKGFRQGDAGCFDTQALVLVNFGNATGKDILQLSQKIAASVKEKFGVTLETEVNII